MSLRAVLSLWRALTDPGPRLGRRGALPAVTKRMNAAKEAIQHEIKSGRPTVEQLEAACKALGLTQ